MGSKNYKKLEKRLNKKIERAVKEITETLSSEISRLKESSEDQRSVEKKNTTKPEKQTEKVLIKHDEMVESSAVKK